MVSIPLSDMLHFRVDVQTKDKDHVVLVYNCPGTHHDRLAVHAHTGPSVPVIDALVIKFPDENAPLFQNWLCRNYFGDNASITAAPPTAPSTPRTPAVADDTRGSPRSVRSFTWSPADLIKIVRRSSNNVRTTDNMSTGTPSRRQSAVIIDPDDLLNMSTSLSGFSSAPSTSSTPNSRSEPIRIVASAPLSSNASPSNSVMDIEGLSSQPDRSQGSPRTSQASPHTEGLAPGSLPRSLSDTPTKADTKSRSSLIVPLRASSSGAADKASFSLQLSDLTQSLTSSVCCRSRSKMIFFRQSSQHVLISHLAGLALPPVHVRQRISLLAV